MTDYKEPKTPEEELQEIETMILFIVENTDKYQINRGSIFDVVASRLIVLGKIADIKHTYTRNSYFIKAIPKITTDTKLIVE